MGVSVTSLRCPASDSVVNDLVYDITLSLNISGTLLVRDIGHFFFVAQKLTCAVPMRAAVQSSSVPINFSHCTVLYQIQLFICTLTQQRLFLTGTKVAVLPTKPSNTIT